MPSADPSPLELASALAARLAHDAMGPASGIASAFDLIADPGAAALREEALALAAESARSLVRLLTLQRMIFGGAEAGGAALAEAARSLFEGSRATLELKLEPLPPPGGALLLGLLQIAREAAASGGRVEAEASLRHGLGVARVSATGPRLRLSEDARAGLAGEPACGQVNRWVGAFMLHAMAARAGGRITVEDYEGGVTLTARIAAATDRAGSSPPSS